MTELVARFLIGGMVVSAFAIFADVVKPKTFAGLFSAAPSVALATLGLAVASKGHEYAALEGRSMIAGAIAFLVYASCAKLMVMHCKIGAGLVTLGLLPVWGGVSFLIWFLWLRS